MNSIVATSTINVAGQLYQAGEVIHCGAAVRENLLRTRQAAEVQSPVSPEQKIEPGPAKPVAKKNVQSNKRTKAS